VMLHNSTDQVYIVKAGNRVAQFLIQLVRQDEVVEVDTLTETERGEGRFSSTGR